MLFQSQGEVAVISPLILAAAKCRAKNRNKYLTNFYWILFSQQGCKLQEEMACDYIKNYQKYFSRIHNDTFTREIRTGTSTNGPMTAAKAAPWWIPKVEIATAIASSKLLEAAVKDRVADSSYLAPAFRLIKKEKKNMSMK